MVDHYESSPKASFWKLALRCDILIKGHIKCIGNVLDDMQPGKFWDNLVRVTLS